MVLLEFRLELFLGFLVASAGARVRDFWLSAGQIFVAKDVAKAPRIASLRIKGAKD
jgi:hypothetical protein